jgi:hypothetical protein
MLVIHRKNLWISTGYKRFGICYKLSKRQRHEINGRKRMIEDLTGT